jgi:hypothetical protein
MYLYVFYMDMNWHQIVHITRSICYLIITRSIIIIVTIIIDIIITMNQINYIT